MALFAGPLPARHFAADSNRVVNVELVAVIIDKHRPPRAEVGLWRSESDSDARFGGETSRHLALRWVVRLRYGLIAGEVALIAALSLGLQISLPVVVIGPAIGFQALSNWLLGRRMQRLGVNAEHVVGGLFSLDALCLTLILAMSGGPANPFSLLYLVQITFSAVVLRKLWTWTLGVLSTLSFGLLFWISRDVPAFHEHAQKGEFSLHLLGMWLAFATAALLISFFVGKQSAEARQKEREILLMQKRLARNDRLASLVTLAAGAAHEIATPLSTIAVTAKEMEHGATHRLRDQRFEEDARLIRSQVERCRLILERMGAQGADPFGEAPKLIELEALLAQVKEKFPDQRERIQIEVDAEGSSSCMVPARAAVEALSALAKNALDASTDGNPIRLRAVQSNEGRVRFTIRDEGIGMNQQVLERVAEPFFTTKTPGQGMGLGAFLAHLFAQTLGGQLQFESEPGRGCTAILELPDMRHAKS
jgi:two-component system sensor histidine kinase RegB